MSKAAMKELIAQQVEPLWKALGDAMKERAEMKLRIDALEASETNLKNKMENLTLNNEQLVDEVEKMRIENAGLRKTLNVMDNTGQFQEQENKDNERKNTELEKMRIDLGEKGGAGHFYGYDAEFNFGGRDAMDEEDLMKVLQLLSLGQKTINLKEMEF